MSAGSCSDSLCIVWIYQWKEDHSYDFSRLLSTYILPIPCVKFYSWSHCTHQSHIIGPLDTPPVVELCENSHCSCPVGTSQPRLTLIHSIPQLIPHVPCSSIVLAHLGLDCHFYIEFCTSAPAHPSPPSARQLVWTLLNPHRCSSAYIWCFWIPVGAPYPRFDAFFHSVLLHHLLCTPLVYTALPIWHCSFPWQLLPILLRIIIVIQSPIQISC